MCVPGGWGLPSALRFVPPRGSALVCAVAAGGLCSRGARRRPLGLVVPLGLLIIAFSFCVATGLQTLGVKASGGSGLRRLFRFQGG